MICITKKHLAVLALFSLSSVALAQLPASQDVKQEEINQLANQVRKSIVTLSNYGVFDHVAFSIAEGSAGYKVALKGYASRPTLKSSAEKVVQKLKNVESVQNDIEVLPNSRNDENIRLQAYAKLYGHPTLSRYNPGRGAPVYGVRRRAAIGISNDPPVGPHPFHIIVKNGNMILEGVVDTEMDKNILNVQANSVSGVFSVVNNVQVLSAARTKEK